MTDSGKLVLSRAEIEELIDAAVVRAVQAVAPRLMTKAQLAESLSVTQAHVDRLVRAGMPREYVGAAPRFDRAACLAWLREHGKKGVAVGTTTATNSGDDLAGIVRVKRRAS